MKQRLRTARLSSRWRSKRRGNQTASSLLKERVSNRHPSCSLMHPCILYTNLKGGLFGVILHHSSRKRILGPVFHLPRCFAKNSGTFVGHLAVAGLMTRARKLPSKDVSAISARTFRQATLILCGFMTCTRQGPAHRPTLQSQR